MATKAGVLGYVGPSGFWWSSRAVIYSSSTLANAYSLYFSSTTVNPLNGPSNRYAGFPLRCLSTVLGYVEMEREETCKSSLCSCRTETGSLPLSISQITSKTCVLRYGGSERIRTSGTVARTHAFQACSLNHSDTLPPSFILT